MYTNEDQARFYDQTKAFLFDKLTLENYNDLVRIMHYHEWKYYVDNSPVISDFEYDQLYEKLQQLEKEYPESKRKDSPTQRVSSDLTSDFPSVTHLNPMLSLANSYNEDDLMDFDRQVKKLCMIPEGDIAYFVEPKLDGGSISLVYENDLLIRAATRGNGVEGEEMTANARAISSVPLSAAFSEFIIHRAELRGEAVIELETFKKINKSREKKGQVLFANPRNAATGGLRIKDANETRKRGLEVFIFQLSYAKDRNGNNVLPSLGSHSSSMEIIGSLGFKIPRKQKMLCRNIDEAIEASHHWEANREKYNYEIDGAVVKVDDFVLQDKCGSTAHHPRWAIAFKFKAKQASTVLSDVEFQVGKTGAITPVAKVEPVHLAGVTVSSISLHNEDFIIQKDLRIGDKVIIERAGDVIPYIVKSLNDLRNGKEEKIRFPSTCPSCDTTLEKSEDQAAWRCPNYYQCEAQILQRIIFHVSKSAMNIDGFGKSYVEKFYKLGWIKDISDVYKLDYDKISELEGFGEKSAENLKSAIDKAKLNPLKKLLVSLNIHHLGSKASKLVAQHINSIFELKEWNIEKFTEIKDIGPVVAENVIAFFSIPENISMLERMQEYGVNMQQTEDDRPVIISENAPFAGKTILFTGTLSQMTRKEAQAKAEAAGAKNISAVSSNLDVLVVGEKAGSKLKKATAIGSVEILTEQEFLDKLNIN
ncbi:MAG: NAD-dependent DNA ligase LigA [Saprospiraceae bacterium]|nr:NAD-dependent DNA ligase LigA [Saprospiraceae bacterium]